MAVGVPPSGALSGCTMRSLSTGETMHPRARQLQAGMIAFQLCLFGFAVSWIVFPQGLWVVIPAAVVAVAWLLWHCSRPL